MLLLLRLVARLTMTHLYSRCAFHVTLDYLLFEKYALYMKKQTVLSLTIVLLLCGSFVFAQDGTGEAAAPVSLFNFGIKAALSLPSYIWFEDLSWNGATSVAAMPAGWVFGAINFTKELSVQIEAGYAGKGARISASDGKLIWRFNYFEVPLLIKYNLDTGSSAAWIAGGGYVATFLGGTYQFDVPESEWNGKGALSTGPLEIVTEIRPYDYGLMLTIGYEIGKLFYEIRFPFGLSPVLAFTPADSEFGGYRRAINSGFSFCLGYKF